MTAKYFQEYLVDKFSDIITEFRFSIMSTTEYQLKFINDKCILCFTYDRGETGCTIQDPNSKQTSKYHVDRVYRFIYPKESIDVEAPLYNFELEAEYYHNLLKSRLAPILRGDFAWTDVLEEKDRELNELIFLINNDLPRDHDLRIKFWNGDLSWVPESRKFFSDKLRK